MRKEELGQAIKQLRTSKGLNQTQLGESIGVASGNISRYESGVNAPDFDRLGPLAEALGVTVAELFTLAENRPSAPVDHAQAATKTIASSLEVLARVLRTVPEPERDAVSRKLASLAMAPDSAQLLQSLQIALQPARPPTESKDIYPAVPSLFTKNKATQ